MRISLLYAYAMFNVPSHSRIENKLNLELSRIIITYTNGAIRCHFVVLSLLLFRCDILPPVALFADRKYQKCSQTIDEQNNY